MKTGFKILLVIASFVVFYFALIPVMQACQSTDSDCTVWEEMMTLTRPVVVASNSFVWNTGDDAGSWTGTTEGIKIPSPEDQIMHNRPFVISMIVLPFVVIGFIVVWDKRK